MSPAPSRGTASFASLTLGWIVAFGVWVLREVYGPGFGSITDFTFMTAWPALFLFLAWGIVVLPALRFDALGERLADPRVSWIAWPALTLLCYAVLVLTWVDGAADLFWFPAIVGVVAGLVFPWVLRIPARAAFVALAPAAAILVFAFVLWPALERLTPYMTYVYGADEARSRSLERVLSRIEVGDSFGDLAARYPRIFTAPTTGIVGNSSAGGRGFTYRIDFDEVGGRIIRVEVTPTPAR